MHPIKILPIAEIQATAATQARHRLDQATIKEYAADMKAGAKFPPIVVFAEDGSERYHMGGGFHRIAAAKQAKLTTIEAEVRAGTLRDALAFALGDNAEHGLRRNSKDKRNAVRIALNDPEWVEWSNTDIARLCRVSDGLVKKVRTDMVSQGVIDEQDTVKTTRDGQTVERKANRASSKKKKEKPAEPEMTDEQKRVARETRKAVNRQTQDEVNKEEFFAGLSQARVACSTHDGTEAVKRWKCHDREGELRYIRAYIDQMLTAIAAE